MKNITQKKNENSTKPILKGFLTIKGQFLFSSIILLIILLPYFEEIFIKWFVTPIFSKIDSSYSNDIFVALGVIYVLILSVNKWIKKFKPSWKILSILVVIISYYSYLRLYSQKWDFIAFKSSTTIVYLDLVYLIALSQILLTANYWYYSRKVKQENKNKGQRTKYSEDLPYNPNSGKEDKLGYTSYAKNVTDCILETTPEQAFAIGINGTWGSGKTSFLKIIKSELDKHSAVIYFDFNPWRTNQPEALAKDFFDTLNEKLSPFGGGLSRKLLHYSNRLASVKGNKLTQTFQAIMVLFTGIDSLDKLFNTVKDEIKEQQRKIVVFIDDLDRLDKKEVIEVVKLIRNTANFSNTFFVVAYDRNYVTTSLKDINDYDPHSFMEKIIQLETSLPYFDESVLEDELLKLLKEKLNDKIYKEIKNHIEENSFYKLNTIRTWLQNLRDVKRLVNTFILNIKQIEEDVNPVELLYIELFRLKFPSIHLMLKNQKTQFLSLTDKGYYQLASGNKKNENGTITTDAYVKLTKELTTNKEALNLNDNEIEDIENFLQKLFSDKKFDQHSKRPLNSLSICSPYNFDSYFSFSQKRIPHKDFINALEGEFEKLKQKLLEWVNHEYEDLLRKKLEEFSSFDTQVAFEQILRAIFFLGNLKAKKGDSNNKVIGFDFHELFNMIIPYKNDNNFLDLIRSIFSDAQFPYIMEATFAHETMQRHQEWMPKEELKQWTHYFLKKYCAEVTSFHTHIFSLHGYCFFPESIPGSANDCEKEPYEIMRNFAINKDLEGFLSACIDGDREHINNDLQYTLGNFTKQVFGTWDNLEKELKKEKYRHNKAIQEFLSFFEKWKVKQEPIKLIFNDFKKYDMNKDWPEHNNVWIEKPNLLLTKLKQDFQVISGQDCLQKRPPTK